MILNTMLIGSISNAIWGTRPLWHSWYRTTHLISPNNCFQIEICQVDVKLCLVRRCHLQNMSQEGLPVWGLSPENSWTLGTLPIVFQTLPFTLKEFVQTEQSSLRAVITWNVRDGTERGGISTKGKDGPSEQMTCKFLLNPKVRFNYLNVHFLNIKYESGIWHFPGQSLCAYYLDEIANTVVYSQSQNVYIRYHFLSKGSCLKEFVDHPHRD